MVAVSAAETFSPPKPRKPPSAPASATLAAIAFSQSRKPGPAAGAFAATRLAPAESSPIAASTTSAGFLPRAWLFSAVRVAKADADPLVAEVAAAYETAEGRDMARAALKLSLIHI